MSDEDDSSTLLIVTITLGVDGRVGLVCAAKFSIRTFVEDVAHIN